MLKKLLSFGLLSLLLLISPKFASANSEVTSQSLEQLEQQQESIPSRKLALIQELRNLTNSEELFEKIFNIMIANLPKQTSQMIQNTRGRQLSEIQQQELDMIMQRVMKRMVALIEEKVALKTIHRVVEIHLYNKYYSEDELQDLVDFYRTPTGQKTLAVMPQLTQDSMKLFNQLFVPQLIEIQQQIIQEELGDLN
ncbi:MAG: DUF2059 domain-containing protein [Moorea sp. SIO2B7]|nr:DUF2059 domain-containing protein [Moorena sp. SIO2B7]